MNVPDVRTLRTVCVVCALTLWAPLRASAQTNSEINTGVEFDLSLPGARSLGLGGAFVAVADDATAAVSNPAGLTALGRPEVSVEGRGWQFLSVTPYEGHAFGPATKVGVDTIEGLTIGGNTSKSTAGLSFVSAVFPKGPFVVGLFFHQQSNYGATVVSNGPFLTNPGGTEGRVPPYTGTMDLKIANYGGSIGYKVNSAVSIGGGVAFSQFSLDSVVANQYYQPDQIALIPPASRPNYTATGQAYGPANFATSNTLSTITETGDDTGVAFNIGALIHPAQKWTIGAAVRRNAEFTYRSESRWRDAHPFPPARGTLIAPPIEDVAFKVPDVYSVGAAYRPSDQLVVSGEFDRVLFSQLSRNLRDVNPETEGPGHEAIVTDLKVPDANQLKVGVEYVLVRGSRIVALRGGGGYESGHHLTYQQTTDVYIPILAVHYPEIDGQWHITPGAGISFRRFQIDAAYDWAERKRTFSASTVFRF